MYLYRVLVGTFSQVRFGQDLGIFNDRFRQFLMYLQLFAEIFCLSGPMRGYFGSSMRPKNKSFFLLVY